MTESGRQPVSIEGTVDGATFYDAVGGHDTFQRLISAFYSRVETDPVLRPLYPEEELGAAAERLRMFLEQYWGSPRTYSEVRGHPRLRARHSPFRVDEAARVAWLANMREALDEIGLHPEADRALWDYLTPAAQMRSNTEWPLNGRSGGRRRRCGGTGSPCRGLAGDRPRARGRRTAPGARPAR